MNPLFPSERVHRKFCSWHSLINTPVNNLAHYLKKRVNNFAMPHCFWSRPVASCCPCTASLCMRIKFTVCLGELSTGVALGGHKYND